MIIECKTCGSEIEIASGQKIAVCEFCGMEQTLPQANNPEKMELFIRANENRMSCRFDVAKKQYENIIAKYPDENEAYWCKILCEYGIEYVDDFTTERKLPTCHRTVKQSIFEAKDYKLIMSRATAEEKAIYKTEANEIDRIQKEILKVAQSEEPYDIFICFKDTEEDGTKRRTVDSQYANKIYTLLSNKGYKVFFSRVTLKSKGGAQYEPVIYSALSTAKVMLLVCANPKHVNAPWVRNEWSRYAEFAEKDFSKALVPCLKDVYPYDLPDELNRYQALDMSELDFYENLSRQIDSKFGRVSVQAPVYTAPSAPVQPVIDEKQSTIKNFIRRAQLYLEDRIFGKADEYAEKVLDIDSDCAEAYLVKLMVDCKVSTSPELASCGVDFAENRNYVKAVRFGDSELKSTLGRYLAENQNVAEKLRKREEDRKLAEEKRKQEEEKAKKEEQRRLFIANLKAKKEEQRRLFIANLKAKKEEQRRLFVTNLKVDDLVKFGRYYQNNSKTKEDIEWRVCDKQDGKVLLMSRYALDRVRYSSRSSVTWANSDLRQFLNGEFISSAFNKSEADAIYSTVVVPDKNPKYATDCGAEVTDKVFVFSKSEVEKYMPLNFNRTCKSTSYVRGKGAYTNNLRDLYCNWWLRTPGPTSKDATIVNTAGYVYYERAAVYYAKADNESVAVRPVLWVDLDLLAEIVIPFEIPPQFATENKANTPSKTEIPPKKTNATLKVGDTYKFGKYYQSNNTTKEDIEWQVLAKEGSKALLISKYGLDCKKYNEEITSVYWSHCTLRKWLNNDFINSAFTGAEKARISTVTVSADKNPRYSTDPGNATQDKVFLVSIPEANKYFGNIFERQCKPTKYAKENGAKANGDGNCSWWLRTPGMYLTCATHVTCVGEVYDGASFVSDLNAVRPAIWVDLEA